MQPEVLESAQELGSDIELQPNSSDVMMLWTAADEILRTEQPGGEGEDLDAQAAPSKPFKDSQCAVVHSLSRLVIHQVLPHTYSADDLLSENLPLNT